MPNHNPNNKPARLGKCFLFMNIFFKTLLANLVLTKGPQDFPYSMVLMRLCLVVYFLTGLPGLASSASFEESVIAMSLDTLVLVIFVYFCLQAFSKNERFTQTVIAMASTGAVFQLAVLPILFNFQVEQPVTEEMFSMSLLLLMIVSWNLAVYANIFRESFSVRLPAAMALTVCYIIFTVVVRKLAFPELN